MELSYSNPHTEPGSSLAPLSACSGCLVGDDIMNTDAAGSPHITPQGSTKCSPQPC